MSLLLLFGGGGGDPGTLVVADSSHQHTTENVALTQGHALTVADTSHGHTSENVTLGDGGTLVVADSAHSHTTENVNWTVSGTAIPLQAGLFSFVGANPVVLLGTDPVWRAVVVRPPAMTEVEEIIPVADPSVPRTFDESHVEQANELGNFGFSTFNTDGLDIALGDLVAFYDRSLCIGGGVIRQKRRHKKSKQHEGKQLVNWTGVRPLGVLEEAPVLPARGFGSSAQDRIWGWFGITYDASTWIPATEVVQYGGGTWWATEAVDDFEDTSASWVWAARRAGDPPLDEWSPQAQHLFRQTGTIPVGVTEVEISYLADAVLEPYFEGESLPVAYWGEPTKKQRVAVVAGSEVLFAAAATNDIDPEGDQDHNPGGALWSVRAIDPSTGQPGTVIMHSDSSAVVLEYVTVRPGVTPGEVLLEVLGEVQAQGFIPWVVPTFTGDVDSGGVPWAEVGEIGTKVGYSLWKLTQQLVAVYIETDLTPATNEWHAWSQGHRGRATGITLDPVLQEHTVTETLMRGNVILDYSKFGWQQHADAPAGERRIAATLGLGALPSSAEVDRWAGAELAECKENRREDEVVILHEDDSTKPYWSYSVGDTVTVDGELLPVQEVSWRRDRQGVIWWDQDDG